jgi:hypothetical protein
MNGTKIKIGLACVLIAFFGIAAVVSYGKNTDVPTISTSDKSADKTATDNPVKTVYAGKVPILLYHSIGQKEARWTRSISNFKKDLQWLYDNGYVLFSIEDFVDNNYGIIPEGKKPVILTFDDGKSNQFKILPDNSIDPNCAIGILDAFYNGHPDFGRAAAFYLNANPFGQPKLVAQKMEYLVSTGRQIGFHTLKHSDMRALSAAQNQKILFEQAAAFQKILPAGTRVDTLAYPHGLTPKGGLKAISFGQKDGVSYNIKLALMIGSEPARQLNDSVTDPYRVPRVQAIDSEWLRHFKRKL